MARYVSHSAVATQAFARRIGRNCPDGILLLLAGDLGSGKTCFVQGLAEGLEVKADEPVSSPTYALMNHYRGRVDLFHFDLYRLADADELAELGFDEIFAGPGVKVVEWPGMLAVADDDGVRIDFSYGEDDAQRILELTALGPQGAALLEAVAGEDEQP